MQREDAMNPDDPSPRVLLVEDDPTTRSYLLALLESLRAGVTAVDSMGAALRSASAGSFDLLLVDARLPDGSGAELLATLRERGVATPALAHTAARGAAELEPLRTAGFADVLSKPVDPVLWTRTLKSYLGIDTRTDAAASTAERAGDETQPQWDDAAASRALGGNAANISALRELFLAELPAQLDALQAGGNGARDILHRLRASCALVGAARLRAAVDHAASPLQAGALLAIVAIGRELLNARQPPPST